MKKFTVLFFLMAFAVGTMFVISCGGGGQKVNSAADEEGQVMDEAKQAKTEDLPTTYLVEDGDTLPAIAEKAEIYGNKYQWPLIFDANKDILDDYKSVKEGMKLIIPRNVNAVEIEGAKQRAQELNYPPSEGGKTASASGGNEAEEDGGEVAGISAGKVSAEESASKGETGVEAGTAMGNEEQPTPIPEPSKKMKKKGGMNGMALLIILLGVIAVIIIFMMSQKKKKEEEEEEKEEKSDNILG